MHWTVIYADEVLKVMGLILSTSLLRGNTKTCILIAWQRGDCALSNDGLP